MFQAAMRRSGAFVITALLLLVATTASMATMPAASASTGEERVRVLAPIESAEIARGPRPEHRYSVEVIAGLPNGCAEPGGYEVRRRGNDIRVRVYNTEPAEPTICTQIYGTYDLTIGLGRDFQRGERYRVDVNGTVLTFIAR